MTNVQVTVEPGDITKVAADALVTAINSGGMWFGGIDSAIQRVAGPMFHNQAAAVRLRDGDAVFARANGPHRGAFTNVVFVVDDLQRPLSQIVEAGLKAADEAGAISVTLPALRTGVMAGAYESPQEAIAQAGIGVRNFVDSGPPTSARSRSWSTTTPPAQAHFGAPSRENVKKVPPSTQMAGPHPSNRT